jgi:hypothetical protein
LGINPTIIQKHVFRAQNLTHGFEKKANPQFWLINNERRFWLVRAQGEAIRPEKEFLLQKPFAENTVASSKAIAPPDDYGPIMAEKYEGVGHLFEAARIYMKLGLSHASSQKDCHRQAVPPGRSKQYLLKAIACLRSEMELYGHSRPKTSKEKLWEFDQSQVKVPLEHPENYHLIAHCLCELGDLRGMGKTEAKSRELCRRTQSDPAFASSVRLLELYRKVMGSYFSHQHDLGKTVGLLKSEQQALSQASPEERHHFLAWFRGLFNLKNPFLVVGMEMEAVNNYCLDTCPSPSERISLQAQKAPFGSSLPSLLERSLRN